MCRTRPAGLDVDRGLLIERPLEDRAKTRVGAGLELESTLTGRFQPRDRVGLPQPHDPEAGAIAHLRVRFAFQDRAHHFGGCRSNRCGPVNQPFQQWRDSIIELRQGEELPVAKAKIQRSARRTAFSTLALSLGLYGRAGMTAVP